jgi:hypothetical protein
MPGEYADFERIKSGNFLAPRPASSVFASIAGLYADANGSSGPDYSNLISTLGERGETVRLIVGQQFVNDLDIIQSGSSFGFGGEQIARQTA